MKKILFLAPLLLTGGTLWAQITFTPYAKAKSHIGKGKPVMLELGTRDCSGCKRMNVILEPFVKKHPNYRIFDVLINEQPKKKLSAAELIGGHTTKTLEEELKMNGYPYQIFYDKNGREAYRHAGVLTAQQLETICHKLGF
jgi:thiol-disulfide isomerase/thioredoxin